MKDQIKAELKKTSTMTEMEERAVLDIWSLSTPEKWRLYRYVCSSTVLPKRPSSVPECPTRHHWTTSTLVYIVLTVVQTDKSVDFLLKCLILIVNTSKK